MKEKILDAMLKFGLEPDDDSWMVEAALLLIPKLSVLEKPKPLLVALHAPQGAGKSTFGKIMKFILGDDVVFMSNDDFYLKGEDMKEVVTKRGEPLYGGRCNWGTHDLELMLKTLLDIKENRVTEIPIYDKRANNGTGDRSKESIKISHPPSLVVVDGWNLGHTPIGSGEGQWEFLEQVLGGQELQSLQKMFDVWICIVTVEDVGLCATKWRMQQEESSLVSRGLIFDQERKSFVTEMMNRTSRVYKIYQRETESFVHRLRKRAKDPDAINIITVNLERRVV